MLTKKCMNTNSKATVGGDGVYVKLLVTIALISRAYNVIMPASIVYDEMFTFKYAKAYLTRTFAFDVHPPLTKMIIAFLMGLFGLDLELNCEIGESLDTFFAGYIALRLISVILFTLSLLMTYSMLCTIRKNSTALFMSLFLVFEVAFQVHYGLIMQDSWVFFYQTAMLYACVKYHKERNIKWVYCIGLAFSFAISSKHSAIFTALPIATWLLIDLFYMACDSQVCVLLSRESVFMHAMHRFVSMVVIPLLVYLTSFYIHFKFQNNYSDDSLSFSLRFQSQLANNYLEEGDKYIIDRSLITLINKETKMYVKSENRFYDTGSKQQVVYAVGEKNERSIWSVVKIHIEDPGDTTEKDMFLKNGDYVKLVHILTDRYLHSHHVEAPTHYDKKFKEVSCYGSSNDGVTDDNDYWVLKADTDYIMARKSELNLFHVRTGTFLAVNTNTAEGRQEVYSSVDGAHKFRDFYIEDNKIDDYYSNNLPDQRVKEKIDAYKPLSFLEMIFEYHKHMLKQNLEIDAQRSFASRPFEWPLMKKGILYWNSFYAENYKKGGKVIYLTGNYVNWALALLIFMMPFVLIINKSMLAKKRTAFKFPFMVEMMFWIFVFNYAPLFLLSREMYLHNYLFAYYHALLVSLYIISLFGFRVMYIAVTCSFAAYVRMLGLMGVQIDTDRCLMHNLGDVCMTV